MKDNIKLYPFDDIYVYVDRFNKKVTLYVISEKEYLYDKIKVAQTIEEFAKDKPGEPLLDVRPETIFEKKQKIIDRYKSSEPHLISISKKVYKERIEELNAKRDEEIEKFMLKYRYLLNSPKLDVCEVKQTNQDYDSDWGTTKTNIEKNYFYRNLDRDFPERVDYIIEGRKNILLQNLSKFKTQYEINYLTEGYNITSLKRLKELQDAVQWSVFDYKKQDKDDMMM